MTSGLLSLKWNNHKSTFFHVLSSIRSKESYCDVTLACDGRFYPVHKLVLSTCSEYFEQMFERTQCKHPIIVLKDVKFDDLEALLNYMYVGEVNVLQEKLAGLIKAAECLKIKGLAVPDEDPLVFNKDNKRSHHNRRDSDDAPHIKRRKRESSSNDDRDSNRSNRTSVKDPLDPLDIPNDKISASRDKLIKFIENSKSFASLNDDSDIDGSEETSKKRPLKESSYNASPKEVAEVYLDDTGVKLEPPDIQDAEEVTECKEDLQSDLVFEPNPEESLGEASGDGGNSNDAYTDSGAISSVPESVEDVAQAMPSSSNFQDNSFPSWEEGSLQNFPNEQLGENSQGRPPMVKLHSTVVEKDEPTTVNDGPSFATAIDSISPFNIGSTYSPSAETFEHDCSLCSKRFPTPSSLQTHMRIHTGEKPFSCRWCTFRSAQKGNLLRHVRIHTGETPFQCEQCPAKYKTKHDLKYHLISKHIINKI